jgi:galactose-1-phosphate uridylyltransferase (family 1)
MTAFHIGREKEMADLNTLAQKKVNTLILGPMGIGKSHILDNFNLGKIIRIDDFRYPKKVLASLLLELFDGDKEAIMQLLLSVEVKDSSGIHQCPTDGKDHPHWHFHMSFYPPLLRSATVKKFMVGYEMFGEAQRDITAEKAANTLRSIQVST